MRFMAHAKLAALGFAALVFANLGFLVGCGGGGSSSSSGEVITASNTSTPQSKGVGESFQPLTVTVTNNGSPMGNVTVTFTAPATGASGVFANNTNTYSGTTNPNGIITATNFKANTKAGSYSVTASASGATSATFSLTNTALAPATITATKGSNQTAALGVGFGTDLEATVVDSDGNPVNGAVVTFTAPSTGASAMFAASTGTGAPGAGPLATATTNSSGVATSPALTAASAIGTYAVTATVSTTAGATTSISFTLTNTVGAAQTVGASNGSGQYAVLGTAFAKTLQSTVEDCCGDPISGVNVTFTVVASGGATGKFANGTATEIDVTDSNGMATSSTFTANGTQGCYTVTATGPKGTTVGTFNLFNVIPSVAATAGVTQTATVNAAFATQLQTTVTGSAGSCTPAAPLTGVTVTYTAPSSGQSGKFADTSSSTTTAVTNASGIANAATFTANGTAGSYSITASVPSASAAASFTLSNTAVVTALAPGTYVFSVAGTDNISGTGVYPYSLAGAVQVGSGGTVTGGELDFNNYFYADDDLIYGSSSTISQGTDGNFILTLTTCNGTDCSSSDPNAGVSGVITLDVALLPQNSHQGLVTEFDSAATGSGTFDLQTSTTFSSGGYAFVLSGLDTFGNPLAMGGVININGAQALNASASVFDANDDDSGTTFSNQPFSGGGVSGVDSFGRIELTLDASDSADFPEIVLAGYLVDGSRVRLVETADPYLGDIGGSALWQGTNTDSFSSSSISSDSYVFGVSGSDANGMLQVASLLTFNSGGNVSGDIDFNDLVLHEPATPDPVTAPSYAVDATGRVTVAGITDGTNAFSLQLYLDGSGHAFAISLDTTDVLGGRGYQQTASSFSAGDFGGAYALDATGWNPGSSQDELDAIGPISADGTSVFSGSFDLNWLLLNSPAELPNKSLNGTFTSHSDGVFTGTITGLDVTSCNLLQSGENGCTVDKFDYYLIDANGDSIAIETDANQLTLGYFFQSQPN
jgi:hypothetical protein